jgi:uncharacterized RDD family membrane protein YckC
MRCADAISPLADPSRRLAAYLLDLVLWTGPTFLLFYGLLVGQSVAWRAAAWFGALAMLVLSAINLRWVRDRGQSIGKRACQLRVVFQDGRRMQLSRIVFMRNVLPFAIALVPIAGAIFGLLDLLFVFRGDRRTVHDLLAGSIVVMVGRPERARRDSRV